MWDVIRLLNSSIAFVSQSISMLYAEIKSTYFVHTNIRFSGDEILPFYESQIHYLRQWFKKILVLCIILVCHQYVTFFLFRFRVLAFIIIFSRVQRKLEAYILISKCLHWFLYGAVVSIKPYKSKKNFHLWAIDRYCNVMTRCSCLRSISSTIHKHSLSD